MNHPRYEIQPEHKLDFRRSIDHPNLTQLARPSSPWGKLTIIKKNYKAVLMALTTSEYKAMRDLTPASAVWMLLRSPTSRRIREHITLQHFSLHLKINARFTLYQDM